jgi:hypothetical protein
MVQLSAKTPPQRWQAGANPSGVYCGWVMVGGSAPRCNTGVYAGVPWSLLAFALGLGQGEVSAYMRCVAASPVGPTACWQVPAVVWCTPGSAVG